MEGQTSFTKTYLLLIVAMMLWGGTFVAGRFLAANFPPFTIAFFRFLSASIVLLFFCLPKKRRLPRLSSIQLLKVILLGLTGIFSYNYFFFAGLSLIEAGRASVIIAINPTLTALLAPLFLKEEWSYKKFLGAFVALSGAIIVITKGHFEVLLNQGVGRGELYLSGAVLSWVSYTMLGKIALKKLSALHATTYACLVGTLFLLPFALRKNALSFIHQASAYDAFAIFFLGALATALGFIWYYQGIQRIGAARAAAFINFVPLFGISSGALLLGEKLDPSLITGALLVITGVSLTNRPQAGFRSQFKKKA